MENKRKILIIVENLPVPFDTRVWQEATTLVQHGYTVSVICPMGKGYEAERELSYGVHIFRHRLPEAGSGALSYAREYGTALYHEIKLAHTVYREIGFDVIHGCNPPDNIWIVAQFFKKYGVKYVFDHHDICPELFEAKFGKKRGLFYQSQVWLERQNYRHSTVSFVTNNSYREIAITRGKMLPENVFVLRSGPRADRMKILPRTPELKRGFPYMVGYVGVIGKQEGLDFLLEAAAWIKQHGNSVFWGIVGGGPYLDTVKRKAAEMGLDDCVCFFGRTDDATMLNVLNTADICVNCDVYNAMNDKSTMNKVLEYMSLGKPIVQFDMTEGRFSSQEASLYAENNNAVDMAQKILWLTEHPEQRSAMGEFGRNRVNDELSWAHTGKALLEGYEKVFG